MEFVTFITSTKQTEQTESLFFFLNNFNAKKYSKETLNPECETLAM